MGQQQSLSESRGNWLQQYKYDLNRESFHVDNTDINIGAKILRNTGNHELYIETKNGRKINITRNSGKEMKENVHTLLKKADGFGTGPTLLFDSLPSHPQVFAFASSETTSGSKYLPFRLNSLADLKRAVKFGHSEKASHYVGSAAIDPYTEKKTTWKSIGAEILKETAQLGAQTMLPLASMVLDDVLPGAGTAMDLTIGPEIQKLLDRATDFQPHTESSSSTYDSHLSDILTDPRLPGFYKQIRKQSERYATETGDVSLIRSLGKETALPSELLRKTQLLSNRNMELYVDKMVQNDSSLREQVQNTGTLTDKLQKISELKPELFSSVQSSPESASELPTDIQEKKKTTVEAQISDTQRADSPVINGDFDDETDKHLIHGYFR